MTNGIIDSGQEIVTNGLVLHLDAAQRRSYSGTGTTWTDLSGNSNNGTLTNGPTFNSANGGSIQVDGTDDYSLVSNKFMTGFTAFTFEMWVYATDNLGGTLCCYNVPTVHSGPQFSFAPNSIGLIVYSGNGSNFIYNYSTTLSNKINTWYHVVSTWTTAGIKLYLNGVDVSGSNVTLGSPPTSIPGDVQGQIVAFRIATGLTNQDSYFKGLISNVKVYNRVLSGAEVLQNYNATKARFEVPALLDLYPNAAAAYSLRKLRSGYTGSAIRVRRSSDNTEQDIGFTSTGDLDTTALTTFVGANNGFVTTWYDQSGNNRNATQTTQADQPQIVRNGLILTVNSKPCIYPLAVAGMNMGFNDSNLGTVNKHIFVVADTTPGENSALYQSVLVTSYNGSGSVGNDFSFSYYHGEPTIRLRNYDGSSFVLNSGTTSGYKIWQTIRTSSLLYIADNNNPYTVGGTPNIVYNSNTYRLGGHVSTGGNSNPKLIQEVIYYPTNQSPNRIGIETNINSYYGIYNPTVATMDTDAQAFITAAGITDLIQQGAINTLVKTLKDVDLWSKMKAIYPFVGGTAAAHKFNLKDPRDLDAAFRLVFSGGWTHSSSGATPNGTTGYADTRLNPNTVLQLNAVHLSVYNRSNLRLSGIIGSSDVSLTNALYLYPRYTDDKEFTRMFSSSGPGSQSLNAQGFWVSSRVSSTGWKVFRNNFLQSSYTITSSNKTSFNTYIGAGNLNGTPEYGVGEFAFATIGDGLTDTEAADLYSAVQTFQTTLGRQL